ncbi:hypothetical protein [Wohlfahrtiimonas populi]|uniref:hypothetical protein n=1 Tax=Wohlfahrtiimonas populi TaxID=1940240 RepID=UPI00098D721A|nr:hypothetical protein [Wohlfahrtiimonas populi]
MRKFFFQLLLIVLVNNAFFSFAEITCVDQKAQTQMLTPISFPILDKPLELMCTEELKDQSISYHSSSINGYKKVDELLDLKIEILSLEDSKAIDDNLLGDDFDENYILNIPYIIKDKKNTEILIEVFEIKRNNNIEALVYISNPSMPKIRFSCVDKKLKFEENNSNYIKKILLSKACQEAIQKFNIPLSRNEINNLIITKGTIN